MFWNLLTSSSDSAATTSGCNAMDFIPWIFIIAAVIVLWFFSRRSQKKQQDQINATLDAIQPGNKVKTIGGVCGVVVEVCPDDNTFILETGSETSGKSYVKFDKKAVYQTDAVPATPETKKEEAPVEEKAEAPFEEAKEDEAPAEEVEKKEE